MPRKVSHKGRRENDDMEEDQLSQASDTMLADTRQTDPDRL